MKTDKLIHVCGYIIKEESLIPVTAHIAEHTCVAEANKPYSEYFGVAPFNMPTQPNSLFFITSHYYTLEEVSRFAKLSNHSCIESLNIASSVINLAHNHHPAIRVQYLPDYKQIEKLQNCFIDLGVEFAKKIHIEGNALIKTNKCFTLSEISEHLYLDYKQSKTGYVGLSHLIYDDKYEQCLHEIRNNTDCPLFNAARGAIFLNGEITDIIRIYSEHISIDLLSCIRKHFEE